jgi:hypothetical protein
MSEILEALVIQVMEVAERIERCDMAGLGRVRRHVRSYLRGLGDDARHAAAQALRGQVGLAREEENYNRIAPLVRRGRVVSPAEALETACYWTDARSIQAADASAHQLAATRRETRRCTDPLEGRRPNAYGIEAARRAVRRLSETSVGISAAHVIGVATGTPVAHMTPAQKRAYVRTVAGA